MASKPTGSGDGSPSKDAKGKKGPDPDYFEEPERTPSEIMREECAMRAMMRKARFKRRWPQITKVKINTVPWHPPPPPQKPPPVIIDLPEIATRRWVPPYLRRRRKRPKRLRIPREEMQKPLPESHKLIKVWHNFKHVACNKMMLQGSIGCNSKKFSSTCGAQTGCIAVVCRALLEEKTPAQLVHKDVDDVIEAGDRYYKQCLVSLKCYKGDPKLQLHQQLTHFFLHDTKYIVKMVEIDRGLLAKHPDQVDATPDLMSMMEKRAGSTYMMILSVGEVRHFLIWGHPPAPEAGSSAKTICYIFDPHMLNQIGLVDKLNGAGAFLRYAGITSFVLDFLANYGNFAGSKKNCPKPSVVLTNIEIFQKEHLIREPTYELDLKALTAHCKHVWQCMNTNALIEKKRFHGEYPLTSLSMVSLAASQARSKKKVKEFYQKLPKEPLPVVPVLPEKAPPNPTVEQIMALKGEDFFLYAPNMEGHAYGRDDLIPLPKSETVLHSPVAVATHHYHSQFHQIDGGRWILRGTRHMASYRYQTFRTYTAIPCCVAALAMLHRHRARAWNEDTIDETLDAGYNLYRESLMPRRGPIRHLTIGEIIETFKIRDREFKHKERNIAYWGRIISSNPLVFDLCRGIEAFFKESDSGLLQIPGEFEVAIWNEGGKYYVYHPWPADRYGYRVGLQDGGKACLLHFTNPTRLCEHFLESVKDLKRKPYSISDIQVFERRKQLPEPVNNMKPVAPGRWIIRGSFHEADPRFPEEHRGRQATPCSLMALGLAHVVDPSQWTKEDIDETLTRGDVLYQSTIENLEKMGISLDSPPKSEGEKSGGSDEETPEEDNSSGSLAAADVLNRFNVTENDCIETDVMDSPFNGHLDPEPGSGFPSLKTVLAHFFKEYSHGVFTARGMSTAIWKQDGYFYFYDPHGCDENGLPSDEPRATACLVRIQGKINELADVLVNNIPPGSDNSFNISPVTITATKLNPEIGAPETKLESKAFEWIRKGTAAIMMGPRGENSAIGKAAQKAGIDDDDKAGRKIALPAAAAFVAAASTIPPPHMHQDHMYNFLDVGSKYYLKHVKETGRTDMKVEDLKDKFEMGANTYTIELDEPTRLPLRQPDLPATEGEGGGEEKEMTGEGEEQPEEMKEMKDLLFKMWYDHTNPTTISLLLGDYHQLGLWMTAGGKVVAFDPAPTLYKGMLTTHRIEKGDELRLQRIKDEMDTEGGGEPEEGGEEAGAEGEAQPEPEPTPVPPEACPALIVAASPGEFIDKLVAQGGLDKKQALGPYWLYKAKVTNELTASLKEKTQKKAVAEEGGDEEEPVDERIPELPDEVIGKYFEKMKRSVASLRGRCSQGENFFMDNPNRNNQDAANSVMGIIVECIEPYTHWKPELLDAILKYGDRLYTLSLPNAKHPPRLHPGEIVKEFHVTNFNVKLQIEPDVVQGDIKAGETGGVLSLRRGIEKFLSENQYGVLCAKAYCVAIFSTGSVMLWEPHAVGPTGLTSPAGAASAIHFSTTDELADTFKANVENLDLDRPGNNSFTISAVKVFWEYSKSKGTVPAQGAVPDEGYEWKVLTAYVETARGRTILRGSRPADLSKFTRDALLQSSCGAIVAAAMSETRRPALWTRRTVDEIMNIAGQLFATSLGSLGYEFRPGEDVLLPLQVLKRFVLGSNYVRYDLHEVSVGKLEQKESSGVTVRSALEHFFDRHTHGILWSVPYAVAVWRVEGAPTYYMMEPHACGPSGLRTDAQDDGAACVLTFTSPKLMAFAYLQNTAPPDRIRHSFHLYSMVISVQPIKKLGADPPIVKQGIGPPGVTLVPATSKVTVEGAPRRASERDRKHPPGSPTCQDAQRASERADKEISQLKGQRNWSGWLVLYDGTQFLSACHSIACKKFSHASRGNQALACSVMSVAMSRVEDVCRWCSGTLDQILESGDQLYQDSYLHFRPPSRILEMHQILRKFYTPGNCVCRVVVYKPRHTGQVNQDLVDKVIEFFREEKLGVLVASPGSFAVALFRTPRGYYMFDPADRDRYGRAVAPPCIGRARACFSQYPSVKSLCDKLGPNIPPDVVVADDMETNADKSQPQPSTSAEPKPAESEKEVHFEQPAMFNIYGMDVTTLRRLNRHER